MNRHKVCLLLFALLAAIQLAQPLYWVWQWEDVLQTGNAYLWKTAPVDPYDAFRGRYIDLRFKDTKGPIPGGEKITYGQTVYATLGADPNGFAYILAISSQKPGSGDYLEATAGYMSGNLLNIIPSFRRYYLREDLASLAEAAYRRSAGKDGVATVRVKNGRCVVEQLSIGNKTIEEYLHSENH
jgi:uncharacterized membrane-anchored protein